MQHENTSAGEVDVSGALYYPDIFPALASASARLGEE